MPWRKNKHLLEEGFADLAYVPRDRGGWDFTLASLAFGIRLAIDKRSPNLNAWAVRHGLPASARYAQLQQDALVLWHGTSRERARKIAEHGLFSKGGLWATTNPTISHGYCRARADRFGTEGAVICVVLDRTQIKEGLDYEQETSEVYRFHHRIDADAVEYVLIGDGIEFAGHAREKQPSPWPTAHLKRQGGQWIPVQKTPVRYSEVASYNTYPQFLALCLDRLCTEMGGITALELFSTLYACTSPAVALEHSQILDLIEDRCNAAGRHRKYQLLRLDQSSTSD